LVSVFNDSLTRSCPLLHVRSSIAEQVDDRISQALDLEARLTKMTELAELYQVNPGSNIMSMIDSFTYSINYAHARC
jgi:hypothetical protein